MNVESISLLNFRYGRVHDGPSYGNLNDILRNYYLCHISQMINASFKPLCGRGIANKRQIKSKTQIFENIIGLAEVRKVWMGSKFRN